MSDTSTHTPETPTEERKPPTIADIVREKTDDGKRIIDFFLDVMEDRIDGAELCHRIDAAKQLVKYGSKDAAEFLAKYKGVPCGHSIDGRPNPADPCTAEDRSLVPVTLNAPPTLTRDFLTVLSGIDEFLMARLIRAQTADAGTIIDFLDDVMQDRNDGFKTHHRIAAAKELIVHIVRDEQPAPTPSPSTGEGGASPESPRRACPVLDTGSESDSLNSERRTSLIPPLPQGEDWDEGDSLNSERRAGLIPPLPQAEGWDEGDSLNSERRTGLIPPLPQAEGWGEGDTYVVPAQTEGNPDNSIVVPAEAGTQGRSGARSTAANPARTEPVLSTAEGSAHPEPNSPVVPAKAGTQGGGGVRSTPANPAHPEPNSSVVPAKAGTQGGSGARSTPANPTHPEPSSTVIPAKSLPRTWYGAGIQQLC